MVPGNNFWSFLAVMLYLFALWFFCKGAGRGALGKIIAVIFVMLSLFFSLLTGSYLVVNWFTGIGFDDSVLYHLRFGVEGAGFSDFYSLIFVFLFVQIIFIVAVVIYLKCYYRNKISLISSSPVIKGAFLVFCAFFCNPATSNLYSYLTTAQALDDFPEYFVKPQYTHVVEKPKNIIYFYLEGLERNYMNESLFPGLLPELHQIEKESVSFTNIGQTIGGSWTMAGMVSSQCGLPLLTAFTNNSFHMANFMPNAVCLGDILKSKGYHLEYMGGADTAFAGKGLFYESHGFINVKGKQEFVSDNTDKNYINNWGVADDLLYASVLKRIKELRQSSTPWGMFSINIGTHQPEGYLAYTCTNIKYADGKDQLLNAAHCTDYLIGKLYRSLKAEGVLDDTLVVFASDHLAPVMVSPYETLQKVDRRNLFMVTGAGLKAAQNSRYGTTLDISPTLLNYLQYGSHPLGLGRDLNGSASTLMEKFPSQSQIDSKLIAWRTIIDIAFWGYPEIKDSLRIDPKMQRLAIGEQLIQFPSLIRYTPQGKIEEIIYKSENLIGDGDNRFFPAFYLINFFSNNQLFLWIDTCRELSTLDSTLKAFGDRYCFYKGTLASTHSSGPVPLEGITLDIKARHDAEFSAQKANVRRKQLADKNVPLWDNITVLDPKTSSFPFVPVMAVGGDSLIKSSNISGESITKSGVHFARVFYQNDPKIGVTYYVDNVVKLPLCDKTQDTVSISKLIKDKPLDKQSTPLFYAILGNADEHCGQGSVNSPVDISLQHLDKLARGNAYIAILNEQLNVVYENVGRSDQAIAVKVNFNKE